MEVLNVFLEDWLLSSCTLVRIPDPWNSSLEFGLEFQGSGVATALEQHTENSMAIPPYTIKVWCQFLQNITSMLFFFQMNGVLTYLSIWKDSWITHLCWSVRYFHGVKWGIRCFIKMAQLSYIAYYASDQFRSENKHPLKLNFRWGQFYQLNLSDNLIHIKRGMVILPIYTSKV